MLFLELKEQEKYGNKIPFDHLGKRKKHVTTIQYATQKKAAEQHDV